MSTPAPAPGPRRRPNRRRRRRNRIRRMIQTYLPVAIIALVILLFIIFVIGSVNRSKARRELEKQASIAASQAAADELLALESEANQLMAEAAYLAKLYDYDAAIAKLESFSGVIDEHDGLLTSRETYRKAKENLVAWDDPTKIVNLSFHLLIADADRAFSHKGYGTSFKWNFITTEEFSSILQQLYNNNYVIVDLYDVFGETKNSDGSVTYEAKTIYLPEGKKPLMLTQTQVNYYTYMTDGDGDGLPDEKGGGFASRLVLDSQGELACEYVDRSGKTLTGDYDFVPILENFLEANPDFSYKGARAILAVCGYDGLFGYRTDPETATKISQSFYEEQLTLLPPVVKALKEKGYRLACYTYGNLAYGSTSATKIHADLESWKKEVTPLLGDIDILVYAKESDISKPKETYSGDKYDVLKNAGFRYYLGFISESTPWAQMNTNYVRQGRLLVTGQKLKAQPEVFKGLFDAAGVMDRER